MNGTKQEQDLINVNFNLMQKNMARVAAMSDSELKNHAELMINRGIFSEIKGKRYYNTGGVIDKPRAIDLQNRLRYLGYDVILVENRNFNRVKLWEVNIRHRDITPSVKPARKQALPGLSGYDTVHNFGGTVYQIHSYGIGTEQEAEAMAAKLKREGYDWTLVKKINNAWTVWKSKSDPSGN